jgi:competence protein ComEC
MPLLLIFALLTGAGGTTIRELALSHNFVAATLNSNPSIDLIATVKSDPIWTTPKVSGSRLKARIMSMLVGSESIELNGERKAIRLPLRVISSSQIMLKVGEKFEVKGSALKSIEIKVAALVIAHGRFTKVRGANRIQQISSSIRQDFQTSAKTIRGPSGALIPGLVIGDTSLESASFITKMRRVGLTHLTAVSGENFAIVAAFILWLAQWFLRRMKLRIAFTALILIGFIFLVRPSPSVMRATVMSAVILLAKARGVRSAPVPSLGLAIALLLLIDPFQAIDPGFALSVGATAGILLLSPKVEAIIFERTSNEKLSQLLAIPISATVMCTPVIIAISGTLSLVSIPANLLAAPVVAPITVIGFIAALISPFIPGLSHALLVLINPFSDVITKIADIGSGFPVLKLPKSYLGAAIILALIIIIRFFKARGLIALLVIGLIGLVGSNSGWPGSNWEVVNCNVGQGDGLAINLGDGAGIVIDAGPDPTLINSCLKSIGIRQIPLLVLTHFHADHVVGLPGVLAGRKIGQVWITNYTEPKFEKELVMKELGATPTRVVTQGGVVGFHSARGEVIIKILWPRNQIENFAAMPGDGSSINNSSVALDITVGKLRIFAGGDIEPPAQEAMLASGQVQPVDILKVSHHGSAYQFLPLMDQLRPKVALISVGAGNTYGHPSLKTIGALTSRGIKVYRTYVDGAISVDPALRIRTKKSEWWNISWG